jgi:hypothetical protein
MCVLRAKPTWAANVNGSGGLRHQPANVVPTSWLHRSGFETPSVLRNSAPPLTWNPHQAHVPPLEGRGLTALEW